MSEKRRKRIAKRWGMGNGKSKERRRGEDCAKGRGGRKKKAKNIGE